MNDPGLIVAIVTTGISAMGVGIFIAGLVMMRQHRARRSRCLSVAKGAVSDITASEGAVFPVFKYEVGSKKYVEKSRTGASNIKYAVGDEVVVHYNPADPHEYFVEGDKLDGLTHIILISMGAFMVAVAILVTVIFAAASAS